MRRMLLCATLAAASLGLAVTAYGQGRPRIVIYEDNDYRGAQIELDRDSSLVGVMNDRASSVRVISGIWELCEHDRLGGRCVTVSRDEPSLGRLGFNDMASSLRLLSGGRDGGGRDGGGRDGGGRNGGGGAGGGLLFFEDVNYGGFSQAVGGTQRSLANTGWNDRVSSIQVRFGVWEVCEHDDFGGRCIQVDRDVPSLVNIGFNDQISSFRRIR